LFALGTPFGILQMIVNVVRENISLILTTPGQEALTHITSGPTTRYQHFEMAKIFEELVQRLDR
jgi:hypothetical protein